MAYLLMVFVVIGDYKIIGRAVLELNGDLSLCILFDGVVK